MLDALCVIGEESVYVEVVAPQQPKESLEQERIVERLNTELGKRVAQCRLEVELLAELTEQSVATIAVAAAATDPGQWIVVEPFARVRRIDRGQLLPSTFDGDGSQVIIGGESDVQGDSTGVIVRWESSDTRAKRVFNAEYHQFSDKVPNLLVVNVTGVADGMKLWPTEMARLLQPARNRKVGAVAFFRQGVVGPPEGVRRQWRVLVNPHAHFPVPEALLAGLESLDESHAFGVPHAQRVVAPLSARAAT